MKRTKEEATLLIVEDDQDFVTLTTLLLEQLGFKQILSARTYHEALAIMDEVPVHLLLLDIDLGRGKNGIMLAQDVRHQYPDLPIIYITSNHTTDYYDYARHTRPSSFLNKELSKLKLYQAVDIALMPFYESASKLPAHDYANIPNFTHHNLYFKVGDVFKTIPIEAIVYFYADRKMSYAKSDNRSYPTSIQLKVLQEELIEQGFLRVHKSYLVNAKCIESIHPSEGTITVSGEVLPIGDTYRKGFLAALKLLK
jgi:DNA-binding LytR/AlgR family response regulator